MKFCGAVARALLIGVKIGGQDVVRIGRGLCAKMALAGEMFFW